MRFLYLPLFCCGLMFSCNSPKPELETAFNENASINTTNTNPLNGIAVNTFINANAHTTSILYGNEMAAQYARTKGDGNYPKGAVLSLVTWKQASDPRWFGANIPDSVISVDVLQFEDTVKYNCYSGKEMRATVNRNAAATILWLRSQKQAILP